MYTFCTALRPLDAEGREKAAIAAAFHDLGIWTDRTFDYLGPSAELARTFLEQQGRSDGIPEVVAMIDNHHKITPYPGPWPLAEAFRRADWVDVSLGALRFGLPRRLIRATCAEFPRAGFHWRLVQLAAARWRAHPLSPLPMVRR